MSAPRFDDPETDRTAAVLYRTLLVVAVAMAVQVWTFPLFTGSLAIGAFFSGLMLCTCLVGLRLIRRARIRPVVITFTAVSWLAVTGGVLVFGGVHNSSALFYLVHLLLVALLWNVRAMLGYAVASCLAVLVIASAESLGVLPQIVTPESPHAAWLGLTVAVVLSASLLHVALGSMRTALESSRRSERRYAELVEDSPDGIVALDAAGRIESVNPEACRILDCERSSVGRPITALAWPGTAAADELTAAVEQTSRGAPPSLFELQIARADGSPLWLAVHLAQRAGKDGSRGVQLILRDVSERHLAERKRERLEEQLRQSEKLNAVGQLAGGIAHDFNNYLTVIRGSCEFALADVPPGSDSAEALAMIEQAADRVETLTRQLLSFSRHRLVERRRIDPNQLVSDMQRLLARTLGEQIRLETRLAASACVRVDPSQLELAVLNLAINARDAMPHGGTLLIETADRRVEPGAALAPGPYVALRLVDDGTGMEPELLSHIFDPFFTTKEEHGTGLGLSTVRGIACEAGGDVSVISTPGAGATFEILLPAHEGAPEHEIAPLGQPRSGAGTVLLVEDEDRVRSVVERMLSDNGYKVLTATNAEEALEIAGRDAGAFDLVLTDLVMPGMGGAQLLEVLRRQRPDLPFVLMSGYSSQEIPAEGRGQGIGYLQKPFSSAELLTRVQQQLEGFPGSPPLEQTSEREPRERARSGFPGTT